jgi:glycerophosphoryl diester phosphodiesterase
MWHCPSTVKLSFDTSDFCLKKLERFTMLMLRVVFVFSLALLVCESSAWSQMIVAHRGASHDAPENTLAAFELAWEQDSDGVEGDFYLTSDGKIVCVHDRDTERTAGAKRIVEQSTLARLRELEYGGWKDRKWKGQIIPTFEQVLLTVPDGKTFVIELKSKTAIVPVLAAELKRLDTSSIRLLIIAFDQATAKACKQRMPSVRVHWLTSFKRGPLGYRPTAQQVAAAVREIGAEGVGMKGVPEVIDAEFIQQLTVGGCDEFHVWTIDSVADARYFQDLGAVGITTNRPGMIGAAVEKVLK